MPSTAPAMKADFTMVTSHSRSHTKSNCVMNQGDNNNKCPGNLIHHIIWRETDEIGTTIYKLYKLYIFACYDGVIFGYTIYAFGRYVLAWKPDKW